MSTEKELPKEDIGDSDGFADWTVNSCSLSGAVFTVAATRDFVTYDVHDLDFVSGPMILLFAWGMTTPGSPSTLIYHDGGYIPKSISLWGEQIQAFNKSTFESDYDTQVLQMQNATIDNQTTYSCRGFNMTQKNDLATHAIAFEPLIDPLNEPYVHHIVIYVCSSPVPSSTFECINMPPTCGGGLMWAWGKGGNPFVLPAVTGLPVGTTNRIYVALQVHYNNVNDVQDLVDNSGVTVYRTNLLRAANTSLLVMGSIQVNLSYGFPAIGMAGECNSTVTAAWPLSGLNVYNSFVHLHQRGRRIWTNVFRNGSLIGTMGNNQAYDFDLQKVVVLSPTVTILPGDSFVTYCTFDTSKDTKDIYYGETTQHEMCINIMAYYPAFGTRGTLSCGMNGNPDGAVRPGNASCALLPHHPPAAYVVQGWAVSDRYYLSGGTASCAPGFTGTAVLGCTGYGATFTFGGCRRASNTPAPTSAPTAVNPSLNSAFLPGMSVGTLASLLLFA
jgi:hypothetical protein